MGFAGSAQSGAGPFVQFILYCEQNAVRHSDALIADHPAIQLYCQGRYGKQAHYIAYGAVIPKSCNTSLLEGFALQPQGISTWLRAWSQNNIEMILDGYLQSGECTAICGRGEV